MRNALETVAARAWARIARCFPAQGEIGGIRHAIPKASIPAYCSCMRRIRRLERIKGFLSWRLAASRLTIGILVPIPVFAANATTPIAILRLLPNQPCNRLWRATVAFGRSDLLLTPPTARPAKPDTQPSNPSARMDWLADGIFEAAGDAMAAVECYLEGPWPGGALAEPPTIPREPHPHMQARQSRPDR